MTQVVDASVLIAALIDPGRLGRWAVDVIREGGLVAPHLMPVECAHALRRAALTGKVAPGTASVAHTELLDLEVDLFPYLPLAFRIWELRAQVTPYDAWYVALAESLDAALVTLDRRLASASGIRRTVRTVHA